MSKEIIDLLNSLLTKELVASQIYMLFGIELEHQGIKAMSDLFFQESGEEMGHVKKLGQRIAFLSSQVLMVHKSSEIIHSAEKCNDLKSIVEFSLNFEEKAIQKYRDAIQICESDTHKDFGTADLLHEILHEEESHVDMFRKEIKLIKQLGIELYTKHKI